jgi:esterase/lipase superfamily enzyme
VAAALLLSAGLSGCILPIAEYDSTPWQSYVAPATCQGAAEGPSADMPHFLVAARLPDCRQSLPRFTVQRTDRLRYGYFAAPAMSDGRVKPAQMADRFAFASADGWWRALAHAAQAYDGRVLITIHGYNESFASSTRDAADIATRTGFAGPLVHYSWPSRAEIRGYAVDENNAQYEEEYLAATLLQIAALPEVTDIRLIAHSLGNKLLLPAIEHVERHDSKAAAKLRTIIMASPDFDRRLFERKAQSALLLPERVAAGRTISVYVSAKDVPIGVSRRVHALARLGRPDCDVPRRDQGDARCYPEWPAGRSGLTIVDTSAVSQGTFGHSDYLRSAVGCTDLRRVLAGQSDWPGRTAVEGQPHVVTLRADAPVDAACGEP